MSLSRFRPAAALVRAAGIVVAVIAFAQPAVAQSEAALRTFFEGKRVTVKIDMPGTNYGIDVFPDASRPLDYNRYGQRLKQYGTAIRAGDSSTVTLIKLKKDLIEFQLGGGGYGTFGDDTGSVYIPSAQKSNREKDLEKRVKSETDPRRKRELQRELDDERADRERENRRIEAERRIAEERNKERIADLRLRGGSRFNLRYPAGVPGGIKPEEVMAALTEWVDFGPSAINPGASARPADTHGVQADAQPRKGMSRAEAIRLFGKPLDPPVTKDQGALKVTTLVFIRGDERITCDFVDDVLVKYTIASK